MSNRASERLYRRRVGVLAARAAALLAVAALGGLSGCSSSGKVGSDDSAETESYRAEACAQLQTYSTRGFPTSSSYEAIDLLLSAAQRFEVAGDYEASRAIQDRAVPAMESGLVGQLEVPKILRSIYEASC